MATVFDNSRAVITNSDTEIVLCPTGKNIIIIGLTFTNVTGSGTTMDLYTRFNTGSGTEDRKITDDLPMGSKVSWSPLPDIGKIVLSPGDSLRALCGAANAIDATCSYLQIDIV
jgi:hypothetical protein